MNLTKFIDTILPPDTWFAVVVPDGVYWRHTWISAQARLGRDVQELMPSDAFTAERAYFSCAGYHTEGTQWAGRTKANTAQVRAFWIDVDAGPVKVAKHGDTVYTTQDEAIAAVGAFCKTHFLAPTYMVDSGQGVHVYWAFETPVPVKLWAETLAPRFAQLCASAGLKVDSARTCDTASVLRLPGSRAGDGQVRILYDGAVHSLDVLAQKLPRTLAQATKPFQAPVAGTPRTPYKAVWVIQKAQAGEGCAQIQALLASGGNAPEPLWRAGLSVMFHGDDAHAEKEDAIARMSSGHPGYHAQKALTKAAETLGPYTCASWAEINPQPCAGCRFNTLAKNPSRFGHEANQSNWELAASRPTPLDLLLKGMPRLSPAQVKAPSCERVEPRAPLAQSHIEPLPEQDYEDAAVDEGDTTAPISYEAWLDAHPKLTPFKLSNGAVTKYIVGGGANDPAKYIVGQWRASAAAEDWNDLYPAELPASADAQKYGVTRVSRNAEGAISALVVCDGTIIPRAIVVTPPTSAGATDASGQLIVDYYSAIGQGTVSVGTSKYSAGSRGDALAVMMGNIGVTLDFAGLKGFLMYLQTAASTMVNRRGNIEQAVSMGWTGNNSFILGANEYLTNGAVRAVSLPDSLKNFATLGTTAGTLASWNSLLAAMYATGAEADMPLQFALMAGFGAPVHARGQDVGGVIHLFSAASAAGKSTVQRAIAAIYDAPKSPSNHPTMLIAAKTDTTKARTHKLGMLNSLALLNDEITEMSPQDVAAFIYTSTQGRANDRMASDANRLRENNTNWGAYTITSSNKRLSDVYSRIMQDSEGMAKRVWEIEIPAVRVVGGFADDARVVAPLLAGDVYGVAGGAWIKWLVSNWTQVSLEKNKMVARLVADAGLTRADRFFANMAASALVSAQFAKGLGLHPFDVNALYYYVVDLLAIASVSTTTTDQIVAVIKRFITRNLTRVSRIDATGAFSLMLNPPANGVVGVFNAVDHTLAISEAALLEAAGAAQGSPAEMRRVLRNLGVVAPTKIANDPLVPITDCFVIDTRSPAARRLAIGRVEAMECA